MAPLGPILRRLLDPGAETVVYECRNCGTSLDSTAESCTNCGSRSIACHRLE